MTEEEKDKHTNLANQTKKSIGIEILQLLDDLSDPDLRDSLLAIYRKEVMNKTKDKYLSFYSSLQEQAHECGTEISDF